MSTTNSRISSPIEEKVRCFLFDFGNVIGLFDQEIAFRKIISLANVPLELEQVRSAVHADSLFRIFERGEISAEQFLESIRKRLDISVPLEDMARAWVEIVQPNEDVIAVLPKLKESSYRLVLGSNNNELHYEKIWNDYPDVLSLFDELVFSHKVGVIKPDPAFFDVCVDACGFDPSRIIYVDDLEVNIRAGEEYGFRTLHYWAGMPVLEGLRGLGVVVHD